MKNIKIVLALLASLVVTACGGGGSDNGLGNSVPNTPLLIKSDTTQIKNITATVLNTTSGSAIEAFSVEDLLDSLNNIPCTSGIMNISSPNPTTGTITFFDCSYVPGKSFRGTVTYSNLVTTPAGNTFNPSAVYAKLNFDLTVTKSLNAPFTLLGDYSLNTSGLGTFTTTTNTTSTAGSSLRVSSNLTEVISDFGFQNVLFAASNTTDNNFFTLASSFLGGIVSYDTTTPFVTNNALTRTFPSAGVAIVTSAANSNELLITILGDESSPASSQVKVEFSPNGGGIYTSSTLYTWAQLFP